MPARPLSLCVEEAGAQALAGRLATQQTMVVPASILREVRQVFFCVYIHTYQRITYHYLRDSDRICLW